MRTRLVRNLIAAALVGAVALATTSTQAQTPPKMKMTTDIPPGVASPDKVDTRLGTLNFFDGFPDKATVEKVYDNLDFQRAVQAYLLALAPVNMAGLREGLLGVGPANVTIPTFEANMNARSVFLTANATTPYTWIWINLHGGPLVVEAPPMTLGMIDDFWFKYVTDIGIVGPDQGKGGKYLLLPPGYKGQVPQGYMVVRVPTFESILVWRNMPVKGDIKPAIERLHKNTRIYPLSQAANPPSNTFVNVSDRDFCTVAPADYRQHHGRGRALPPGAGSAATPTGPDAGELRLHRRERRSASGVVGRVA